jgi:hypothetical protein
MNIGGGGNGNVSAGKKNGMNHQRKLLMEKIEKNPAKYNQCWSKPWTEYTWRELLELWTADINSKPH